MAKWESKNGRDVLNKLKTLFFETGRASPTGGAVHETEWGEVRAKERRQKSEATPGGISSGKFLSKDREDIKCLNVWGPNYLKIGSVAMSPIRGRGRRGGGRWEKEKKQGL